MMIDIIEKMKGLDIRESTSNGDLLNLHNLLLSIAKDNMKVIEIGCWKGSSTAILASVLKQFKNSKLYCIDNWKGINNEYKPNVRQIFEYNIDYLGFSDIIDVVFLDSFTASQNFDDDSIDFIFIDGDHTFVPFKNDVKLYWPKLKINGIMSGHDAECYYSICDPNDKNLIENNKGIDYVKQMHCGVIFGLYELFNDKHILLKDILWYKNKRGANVLF